MRANGHRRYLAALATPTHRPRPHNVSSRAIHSSLFRTIRRTLSPSPTAATQAPVTERPIALPPVSNRGAHHAITLLHLSQNPAAGRHRHHDRRGTPPRLLVHDAQRELPALRAN